MIGSVCDGILVEVSVCDCDGVLVYYSEEEVFV